MLEQLKSLISPQARGQAPEFVFSLTPEIRKSILLDVRYVLRDAARARELPLLVMLGQTADRNHTRIRFPGEVLARLAREIETIRPRLPGDSPLLGLADGAREHLGDAALVPRDEKAEEAAAARRDAAAAAEGAASTSVMDLPLEAPAAAPRGAAREAAPAASREAARGSSSQDAFRGASSRDASRGTAQESSRGAAPPAAPHGTPPEAPPAAVDPAATVIFTAAGLRAARAGLSASAAQARHGLRGGRGTMSLTPEELQAARKRASDAAADQHVTTLELGDQALAGYLNYCLTLGDYEKIIETLLARVETQPRVWAWNMLVTAMRLSGHRDFSFTAARFHVWLAQNHPESISHEADGADPVHGQRKFSSEVIAELERAELGD